MKQYIVWVLVIFSSLFAYIRIVSIMSPVFDTGSSLANDIGFAILVVAFSVFGALIILRAEGNRVGWLMVLLGFTLANPFNIYLAFDEMTLRVHRSFGFFFAIWIYGWFFFITI